MKITRYSGDGKSRKVMDLCTLLESMKKEKTSTPVAFARENIGSRPLTGEVVGMDKITLNAKTQ